MNDEQMKECREAFVNRMIVRYFAACGQHANQTGLEAVIEAAYELRQGDTELLKLRAAAAYVIERMEHAMRCTDKENEAAWLDGLIDQLKGATESTSELNPLNRESKQPDMVKLRDEIIDTFLAVSPDAELGHIEVGYATEIITTAFAPWCGEGE